MSLRTKKIIYSVLIVLGVAVIAVIFVRAGYDATFLSGRTPEPLVSVVDMPPASDTSNPSDGTADSAATGDQTASSGSAQNPTAAVTQTVSPHLSIPSIKLNAAIESVGLDSHGNMDTPVRLADVGWYKFGTAIGDVGSAVIDGHVDDSLALPAVFYNLKNVQKGDDVYVTTSGGTSLHFVVTDVENYALATAPVNAIFNDTSGARLIRLITCDGTWSEGQFSYDHRIVVTAELQAS